MGGSVCVYAPGLLGVCVASFIAGKLTVNTTQISKWPARLAPPRHGPCLPLNLSTSFVPLTPAGNFLLASADPSARLKAIDFGLAVFFEEDKLPRTDLGLEGTPW